MNHYNKVRKTLAQMTNLRDACNELIAQCEAELNKQPIDTSKTLNELVAELELNELKEEFENLQKSKQEPAHDGVLEQMQNKISTMPQRLGPRLNNTLEQLKTSAELQAEKQRLFQAKEQIIRDITRNDNNDNS